MTTSELIWSALGSISALVTVAILLCAGWKASWPESLLYFGIAMAILRGGRR